jgi:molybdenum cofactor cytidylyltransferase
MLSVQLGSSPADLPLEAIVCHDVRNPAQLGEVLARKGTALRADEIGALLEGGISELHLALPDPCDVPENEAAARMAAAVIGPRVKAGDAHYGQPSLMSTERGMLRVRVDRLNRVNEHDGVLVLTTEADRPVDVGTTLGVVKCAPLFLPESTIVAVEDVATASGPCVELEAFRAKRVGLVAPRERLRGGALDRTQAALSEALTWYGSSLGPVVAPYHAGDLGAG